MGDISDNFSRYEFECKCGCGQDTVDAELIMLCELIRRLNGNKPLTVNSGNRCPSHNRIVGGKLFSQHLHGRAADLPVDDPKYIYNKLCGIFKDKFGFGLYANFIHVDSRVKKWRSTRG